MAEGTRARGRRKGSVASAPILGAPASCEPETGAGERTVNAPGFA